MKNESLGAQNPYPFMPVTVKWGKASMTVMTIGIAVCLPDGALLIADGLIVQTVSEKRVLCHDAQKITPISSTFAALTYGLKVGTNHALSVINSATLETATSDSDIENEIERSSCLGWEHLQSWLRVAKLGGVNVPAPEDISLGFLVGGYTKTSPGGGLIICTAYPEPHSPSKVETRAGVGFVIAPDRVGAQAIFDEYCLEEYDRMTSIGARGRKNKDQVFITAGVRTINEVSESDPQIGGTIRYTIIRRGFLTIEGTAT